MYFLQDTSTCIKKKYVDEILQFSEIYVKWNINDEWHETVTVLAQTANVIGKTRKYLN